MSIKTLATTFLVATALLAVPAGTYAATGKHAHMAGAKLQNAVRIQGTVASANATSLTVTEKNGTNVTVNITSTTRLAVNGQKATALPATFAAKTPVRVLATKAADGSLTAVAVQVGTFPKANGTRISGTITASSASSVTITERNGTQVTVAITSTTRFAVNGQKVAGLSAFPANALVHVTALKAADGTLQARTVASGAFGARISGTVASVSGSSVTVTRKNGRQVTITITSSTRVVTRTTSGTSTAQVSLASGQKVSILASKASDGTLTARVIVIHA